MPGRLGDGKPPVAQQPTDRNEGQEQVNTAHEPEDDRRSADGLRGPPSPPAENSAPPNRANTMPAVQAPLRPPIEI